MIKIITLCGQEIKYEFQRKNVKNINLRIKPDGSVHVSAGTRGSVEQIERFLLSKEDFIHEVCKHVGTDESALLPRNTISRKYMKELDDNIFYDAIRNIPYLVVCFYDFNRPSQTFIPVLDQLSQEYFSKLMVGLYDVYGGSENSSVVSEYNITALPTLLFFKGGKLVNRHIGICSAEDLRVLFNELLKS